jgi:hypothetical protein
MSHLEFEVFFVKCDLAVLSLKNKKLEKIKVK